ncbi:MAG: S24/S26 family peptidase [Myxococcota bacterium]
MLERDQIRDQLVVDALQRQQNVRFRATSASMLPVILPGDLLIVAAQSPQVGDIALFRLGIHWCTHRVVARSNTFYEIAADAIEVSRRVDVVDVLGTVVKIRRDLRSRLLFVRWLVRWLWSKGWRRTGSRRA